MVNGLCDGISWYSSGDGILRWVRWMIQVMAFYGEFFKWCNIMTNISVDAILLWGVQEMQYYVELFNWCNILRNNSSGGVLWINIFLDVLTDVHWMEYHEELYIIQYFQLMIDKNDTVLEFQNLTIYLNNSRVIILLSTLKWPLNYFEFKLRKIQIVITVCEYIICFRVINDERLGSIDWGIG